MTDLLTGEASPDKLAAREKAASGAELNLLDDMFVDSAVPSETKGHINHDEAMLSLDEQLMDSNVHERPAVKVFSPPRIGASGSGCVVDLDTQVAAVDTQLATLYSESPVLGQQAALEAARAELDAMKMSDLQKLARSLGISEEERDAALDADDPKHALVELVFSRKRAEIEESSPPVAEEGKNAE